MVQRNVVGFRTEDGKTDFRGDTLAIAADGTNVPYDRIRVLEGGRWMMLWRELDDSVGVFLIVCVGDQIQWLPMRRPVPCQTEEMILTLNAILRGFGKQPRNEVIFDGS